MILTLRTVADWCKAFANTNLFVNYFIKHRGAHDSQICVKL